MFSYHPLESAEPPPKRILSGEFFDGRGAL